MPFAKNCCSIAESATRIAKIKTHRTAVTAREEAVHSRETAITEKETQLASLLKLKDAEITALQQLIASADERHRHVVEARIRDAVSQREEELRASVMRHQQEVSASMAKREEELLEAIKRREEELRVAWIQREQEIRDEMSTAVEERMEWVRKQMEDVEEERRRLDATRTEVESKMKTVGDGAVVEKTGMDFSSSIMKSYLLSLSLKLEKRKRHILKRSRMFSPRYPG